MTETIVYIDPKNLSLTRFHGLLCQKLFVDELGSFQLASLPQKSFRILSVKKDRQRLVE